MMLCFQSYFLRNAYSADWRFNPELVSNQSPKEIVLMAVREKLLDHLRMKLPYQVSLFLKDWEVDERGTLRLTVRVKCPRKGAMVSFYVCPKFFFIFKLNEFETWVLIGLFSYLQKHVMGENGGRIREIAYEAGQEMMNTFRCEVLLKLIVSY